MLVAYLLVLFQIVVDLFRDKDLSGFTKAIWIIGLLRALIGFGQNAVSNRKFRAALDAERGGPAV